MAQWPSEIGLFCENTNNLCYGNLQFAIKLPTPASPKFKIHEALPYEYVILLDVQNTGENPNVTAKSLSAQRIIFFHST